MSGFARSGDARLLFALLGVVWLTACLCKEPSQSKGDARPTAEQKSLEIIKESKISDLLSGSDKRTRLEASGVMVQGGHFHVAFDNFSEIARLDESLASNPEGDVWRGARGGEGFEAITWREGRFFVVIEALEVAKKTYRARIVTLGDGMEQLKNREVAFDFKGKNKGLEGLSPATWGGEAVMMGLCEGPDCKKKGKGQRGMVLVLKPSGDTWKVIETLKLPKSVGFADYSDIAIDESGRVAVVSQEEGALWLGKLADKGFEGDGEVLRLPLEGGERVYCNIEGVSWVGASTLVMVSDRAKKKQPDRCRGKAESIHLVGF